MAVRGYYIATLFSKVRDRHPGKTWGSNDLKLFPQQRRVTTGWKGEPEGAKKRSRSNFPATGVPLAGDLFTSICGLVDERGGGTGSMPLAGQQQQQPPFEGTLDSTASKYSTTRIAVPKYSQMLATAGRNLTKRSILLAHC